MHTGAPTSEPQAEGSWAGLGGARAPGPTHHERRGAQRHAAGGSMPESERGSGRTSGGGSGAAGGGGRTINRAQMRRS